MAKKWQWTIIGSVAAVALAVLWLEYSAESSYTVRAQVSEGLSLSAGPKAAITDYHATNGRFPETNAAANVDESIQGQYVTSVRIIPGGVIEVTYGAEADDAIAGKVLTLRAAADEETGELSWSCSALEIADNHVPAMCRAPTG